jgi:hypothetical protein
MSMAKTLQSVFCYKGLNTAASATLGGSTFAGLRERQNFIASPFLRNQVGSITFTIDMGMNSLPSQKSGRMDPGTVR